MSKDDIDKAVKEAAAYEAEDKKKKEAIDTRNEADSMVFQTEKTVPPRQTCSACFRRPTPGSAEFRTEAGVEIAKKTCQKLGLEGLVVIGGDGSFRGAADLSAKGIACVGLPGTIDNDIACTEYTIGYDTAMNTCVEMIDKLQDTCQSHDRCSVVEVMGRGAGFIAVNTGLASGAVEIITKEVPYDLDELARKMLECKKNGKQNFIVVVAENIGNAEGIARAIQEKTGIESRATVLGHVQRGGSPTVRDRVVASEMGYYAVELLEKGASNRVVGMQNNKIVDFDIQEALSMKKPYEEHLHQIAQDIAFF